MLTIFTKRIWNAEQCFRNPSAEQADTGLRRRGFHNQLDGTINVQMKPDSAANRNMGNNTERRKSRKKTPTIQARAYKQESHWEVIAPTSEMAFHMAPTVAPGCPGVTVEESMSCSMPTALYHPARILMSGYSHVKQTGPQLLLSTENPSSLSKLT